MKKLKLLIYPFLFVSIITLSCEKDDICAEGTPTTPEMIIRFYDLASQNETKTVSQLYAYALDDSNNVIDINGLSIASRDSLGIPLRTDDNSTRFVLHQDFDIDDNDTPEDTSDDIVLGNPDVITVNYEREDVYVSRACGFKTIFNNISFEVELDGDNWIINSEITNANVDNENSAHVKVFH